MPESKRKHAASVHDLLRWSPEMATEIYQNMK